MWVVKLGGSLLGTPELQEWLSVLMQQSDRNIVIVPGGGIFADAVRSAQRENHFEDATAHHMALLAMEQYGLLLKSLRPELVTAASELEIAERIWQHRAIVWMPSNMVLADDTIPQSWDVTSDSLAAWLSGKIDAERLVLVKHLTMTETRLSVVRLMAHEVLDPAFAEFSARLACPINVMDKSEHAIFASTFTGGALPELVF